MDPLTVTALAAVAILLVFFIHGALHYRSGRDHDSYFLCGRKLANTEFSVSFAAASTSLATVLFFFVFLGVPHGVYILFAPLTLFLGCYLFARILLPRLVEQGYVRNPVHGESPNVTAASTLGTYIRNRYQSRAVAISVLFVTFLGLLSILLIELFVGVTIFSIFLKPEFIDWAVVGISFAVFTYTALGGLAGVVKTDKLQLALLGVATLVFLGWLVWASVSAGNLPDSSDFFVAVPPLSAGLLLPYPLLFNILIVNIFLTPALLRTWQMAAASQDADTVRKGIINGAWITVLLTTAFLALGILFFKRVSPGASMSLEGMLTYLAQHTAWFPSYVLLPLFFAGCLAALLSTADSALLPLVQSSVCDFRQKNALPTWSRATVTFVTAGFLVLANAMYFVVFRWLQFDLMSWLFTIFSFIILSTPVIVFAILAPPSLLRTRFSRSAALVAVWGALAIAIAISVIGNHLGNLALVQLNSPLAALFGSAMILVAWFVGRRNPRKDVNGL